MHNGNRGKKKIPVRQEETLGRTTAHKGGPICLRSAGWRQEGGTGGRGEGGKGKGSVAEGERKQQGQYTASIWSLDIQWGK